jgi:hypothetical protein
VKGYPLIPGVVTPGHFLEGYWHPGEVADCPQCPPVPRPAPVLVEVKVEVVIPHQGSDCKTGKRQFATRKAAMGSYHSLQRRREGLAPRPYKCAWCLTWHVGNRRSNASKGRTRR